MGRSLKKGPFIDVHLIEKVEAMGGLGTTILTTSRGVMTGKEAVKAGVGGEVLCNVW